MGNDADLGELNALGGLGEDIGLGGVDNDDCFGGRGGEASLGGFGEVTGLGEEAGFGETNNRGGLGAEIVFGGLGGDACLSRVGEEAGLGDLDNVAFFGGLACDVVVMKSGLEESLAAIRSNSGAADGWHCAPAQRFYENEVTGRPLKNQTRNPQLQRHELCAGYISNRKLIFPNLYVT